MATGRGPIHRPGIAGPRPSWCTAHTPTFRLPGPDKEAEARVPTWNYAVAHLHGTLETFDDEASLAAIVDGLSQQHEGRVGEDWRFELERDDHRVQLRGIVGFRFRVDNVALKFKLSQNHPVTNRHAVAAQLEQQSREASREIADLMRARTPSED